MSLTHTETKVPHSEDVKPHFARTPEGLTTVNGRIDKVRALKDRMKHTALPFPTITGTVAGGIGILGSSTNLLHAVVGTLGVLALGGMATYVVHLNKKDAVFEAYKHLFASQEMGKSAIRCAEQTLILLDPTRGTDGLWGGLEQLEMLLKRRGQTPNRTPAGTGLEPEEVIFTDEPATFAIIMRESLFAYVKLATKENTTPDALPILMQQYIAENFPDVISAQTNCFSSDILNAYHPGLHEVVQTLLATGSTEDELRGQIMGWVEQGQRKSVVSENSMPQDFF